MSDRCEEFDRRPASGEPEGAAEASWREHLAGCAVCTEQARAEVLLRAALGTPVPEPAAGFEARLRQRLERRAARRRPARRHILGWWVLAAYGTAAVIASAWIAARLPWESLTLSPAVGMALGALALLSPLALLDRVGIVRPPG